MNNYEHTYNCKEYNLRRVHHDCVCHVDQLSQLQRRIAKLEADVKTLESEKAKLLEDVNNLRSENYDLRFEISSVS